jgi:hypothetical protein
MRHTALMSTSAALYHRHRFPAEIISHSVWLYFRFALSFRDVEEMLAQRGVSLSYETVREWCLKFAQTYANVMRHDLLARAIGGTLMKCSSRSTDAFTTSGGQWIRMETCWISWSKVREIRGRPEILSQVIKRFALCSACDHY